jgi:multidrug efflux pump subunit AcrA (membrane-fusion protein)
MRLLPKAAGLSAGLVVALSLVASAQQRATRSPGETLVVQGNLDWLEKSDVSALREGVIEQIEFRVGDRVEAGKPIGYLHKKLAELGLKKAQVAAESKGALRKAEAQQELAKQQLAILTNVRNKDPRNVTMEEMRKAEAELLTAQAMVQEARDNIALAEVEVELNKQALDEHTILAPPFTGYVTLRMKNPNESVRASEPVLQIGRIDKLQFHGYLPYESAARVRIGDAVEFRPTIEEAELPVEQKRFVGKVRALSKEVSTVGRTEVQVLAEIDNPEDLQQSGMELLAGMKGEMTITLGSAAPGAVTQRTAPPAR